jgi:hypothetical protein
MSVDLDPLGLHVDQQKADALLLLALCAGAHEAEDPVGDLGVAGPDLGAVDHVVVTIPLRPGLEAREVRTGAGLRVALAPPHITRQRGRQEPLFLLVIAEGVDHRGHHVDAKRHQTLSPRRGSFEVKNVFLGIRPAGAAVFFRPVGGRPAFFVHLLVPGRHGLAKGLGVFQALDNVVVPFSGKKSAHLVAKGEIFCGKARIHGYLLRKEFEPTVGFCCVQVLTV